MNFVLCCPHPKLTPALVDTRRHTQTQYPFDKLDAISNKVNNCEKG